MKKNIPSDFTTQLENLYGEREARSILKLYNETKGELTPLDAERMLSAEPLQYILGEAHFYGREFNVNPSTLIPRGETEELVVEVVKSLGKDFNGTILDIGTGSGIIAITLKKELPNAKVSAIDISAGAIEIAKSNAEKFEANVDFKVQDIFECTELDYDVVVSNPPYVTEKEKEQMHPNVLDFEPSTALFVSDHDPLIYYREIAKLSKRVFFEINEHFGNEMSDMLSSLDYTDIEIIKDIHDRPRICTAKRLN